jgi:hypothetical protein
MPVILAAMISKTAFAMSQHSKPQVFTPPMGDLTGFQMSGNPTSAFHAIVLVVLRM